MGVGKRIAATVGAAGAAAVGAVVPLNQYDSIHGYNTADEVPPFYQAQDSPSEYLTPEQIEEGQRFIISNPQEESQPSAQQKVGEVGNNAQDIAGTFAEAGNAKEKAEDVERDINASRQPDQTTSSEGELADSGPNNDGDYDYYNGLGY